MAAILSCRLDLSTTSDDKSDALNNILITYKCEGCETPNDIKIIDMFEHTHNWTPTEQGFFKCVSCQKG